MAYKEVLLDKSKLESKENPDSGTWRQVITINTLGRLQRMPGHNEGITDETHNEGTFQPCSSGRTCPDGGENVLFYRIKQLD